ncbi:MAG: hypothetical protein GEV03_23730 [Streptosporangiales bacterium]|nr:hypothetical protein [Streptosporangiales bacterium]
MSGNYPPPEGDPPGRGPAYGAGPGRGWQPPGESRGYGPYSGPPRPPQLPAPQQPPGPPGYAHPGYPPRPGYGRPAYGQPGHHGPGIPNMRPEFIPPERLPTYGWGWGQEFGYGDPRHGYPGWMEPADQGIQTNSIFALVVSVITLFCCSNIFAIGGVVLSIIAMTMWREQPESARNLNKWAWICTGGGLVLIVLFVLAVFLIPLIPLLGMSDI